MNGAKVISYDVTLDSLFNKRDATTCRDEAMTRFKILIRVSMLLLCSEPSLQVIAGTSYFVGTTGNDSNPGTTRTNALRTIQSAVTKVGPGDSIIVLAGT